MSFIKRMLSEPNGDPSSQRFALIMLLIFTMNLISCAFYIENRLPQVPESLVSLIQWLFVAAVGGIGVGKVTAAVVAVKGGEDVGQIQQ